MHAWLYLSILSKFCALRQGCFRSPWSHIAWLNVITTFMIVVVSHVTCDFLESSCFCQKLDQPSAVPLTEKDITLKSGIKVLSDFRPTSVKCSCWLCSLAACQGLISGCCENILDLKMVLPHFKCIPCGLKQGGWYRSIFVHFWCCLFISQSEYAQSSMPRFRPGAPPHTQERSEERAKRVSWFENLESSPANLAHWMAYTETVKHQLLNFIHMHISYTSGMSVSG